jgi:hypothetical protein
LFPKHPGSSTNLLDRNRLWLWPVIRSLFGQQPSKSVTWYTVILTWHDRVQRQRFVNNINTLLLTYSHCYVICSFYAW